MPRGGAGSCSCALCLQGFRGAVLGFLGLFGSGFLLLFLFLFLVVLGFGFLLRMMMLVLMRWKASLVVAFLTPTF